LVPELVPDLAQVDAGTKTRDIAAQRAGFGGHFAHRQAGHGSNRLARARQDGLSRHVRQLSAPGITGR